ncbi:PD-(D/E)XK nuclease family protein [Streptomyces sp. A1277]|uniref:PD-(D/E)XK nuclease family protein n=1 Tax=Streptomyces sp. A1277 TaxID=2563103 RepID=UPI001447B1B1|nr:PD-(D/E)XK nuclease family protein [Streptomyces sp. A1277]
MPAWMAPRESTWTSGLIRVFAGSFLRPNAHGSCPYKGALKARAGIRLAPGPLPAYKADAREGFNLGPLGEALDLIEYEDVDAEEALRRALTATRERPRADPGLVSWTRSALDRYLENSTPDLRPVPYSWVLVTRLEKPDGRGARRYEQCVWGRPYASADGRLRELRVPVARGLSGPGQEASERVGHAERADLAAAAQVVAFGEPHRLPDRFHWSHAARPVRDVGEAALRKPEEVRITEVSCLDGERREVLSEGPEDVARRYAVHGRPRLTAAVSAGTFLPGHDCEDCKYAPSCPALPRLGGLLGIEELNRPRRTWSITNGRSYVGRPDRDESCPARERLRRLRLPDPEARALTPHVVRGHAVHTWIQQHHEAHPGIACRPDDAPDGRAPWSAGRWTVPPDQADLGARMVAAHARHCPYRLSTVSELVHERTLVAHDADADVVVLAKTDTLYLDGSSWVYRETKTDARRDPPPETDVLRERPQLALAVLLSTSPVVGEDVSAARVELEVLGPRGARLTVIDPFDTEIRASARQVVRSLASDWHADTTAVARPGPHCRTCEMSVWCRPALPDPTKG